MDGTVRHYFLSHGWNIEVDGRRFRVLALRLEGAQIVGDGIYEDGIELLTRVAVPDAMFADQEFTHQGRRLRGAVAIRELLASQEG